MLPFLSRQPRSGSSGRGVVPPTFVLSIATVAIVLFSCRGNGPISDAVQLPDETCDDHEVTDSTSPDDATTVEKVEYDDVFVPRQRLPGSRFVEILEVRAHPDGRVFFCTGVQGLVIADGRNPSEMTTITRLAASVGSGSYPRCQHLAWSGDRVYFTNRGDEIQPTSFIAAFEVLGNTSREIDVVERPEASFEGIAASGDLLYAAAHEDGLVVFEFDTQSHSLTEIATLSDFENAWGVAVAGDTLYVADGPGGLVTVDVSEPASPVILGRAEIGGSAQSVEVDAERGVAVVAAGSVGLATVDVSDPAAPAVLAKVDTPGSALQVALDGSYAFLADWNLVRVFDLDDPSAPRLVTTENVSTESPFSRVLGIGARDGVAFLGEWTGLYSYELVGDAPAPDVTFRTGQVSVGSVPEGESDATVVVIANEGGAPLQVCDVSVRGDDEDAFSVSSDPFVLEPDERKAIELVFTARDDFTAHADLIVISNDPDEAAAGIPIVANQPGSGVGDMAPDVEVRFLDGSTWRLADARGSPVVLAYFATF